MGCNKYVKQVCSVEVVIDGITANVKEQLRKKSGNGTRGNTLHILHICKKDQNSVSIIKRTNQYELR